jgi:acyl-CoA thioester hydrolase
MATHTLPVRVYYEDTDAGGIVYHANYLKFFERGRTEYLRSFGVAQGALRAEHGMIFAVRSCAVEYLAPARLDDALLVTTAITTLGGSRLELSQTITLSERLLTTAQVTVVAVGADGRAMRIPAVLRECITPLIVPATQGITEVACL